MQAARFSKLVVYVGEPHCFLSAGNAPADADQQLEAHGLSRPQLCRYYRRGFAPVLALSAY